LRHNEDNFNRELSDIAPYKIKDCSSPQGKAFLLFQMHLFDLPPPIRDYVTDGKLILDASTRVVLGAIEVAKEKNLLDAVLMLIYFEQLIFQGFQCNIPYVSQSLWNQIQVSEYPKGFRGGLA
jgi:activating signal cointegrator complex subunit 3